MALTSDFSLSASGLYTKVGDLSTPSDDLSWRRTAHLDSGTGAGKADLRFTDTRTLAASATEDLDLAGTLLDVFGAALTFVRIKALMISAATTNTNNVIIGAAATNPWIGLLNAAGTITLRPGQWIGSGSGAADATCMAVTAGTGDLLKIANSAAGTSVTYDILIVGASA